MNDGVTDLAASKASESSMKIQAHLVPDKVALATITPDLLNRLAFISTYSSEDPKSSSPQQHGYQRDPMEERFMGIGKYYAKNGNRNLIPPIIASVRVENHADRVRFDELFDAGDINGIHQEFDRSVFSIVDGQHRAGGLSWAWDNVEDFVAKVPVMLFYGLDYPEEAQLFDDINTNQRKLPKALIEATKVHVEAGDKGHAQLVREVSFAVAQDGDSVWYGKINMTGARDPDRSVTYEGLRRSTGQMFPDRMFGRLENRNIAPADVAKKYWSLVAKASSPAWNEKPRLVKDDDGNTVEESVKYRLKDLVGVASLAKLGEDIISTALDKSQNKDEFYSAMTDLVSTLSEVDWEKRPGNPWMASQAGFAGQKDLYEILYNRVYNGVSPGDAVDPS